MHQENQDLKVNPTYGVTPTRDESLSDFIRENHLSVGRIFLSEDDAEIVGYIGPQGQILFVLRYPDEAGWDILVLVSKSISAESTLQAAERYLQEVSDVA